MRSESAAATRATKPSSPLVPRADSTTLHRTAPTGSAQHAARRQGLGKQLASSRCHDQPEVDCQLTQRAKRLGQDVWTVSRQLLLNGDNPARMLALPVGRASGAKVHYLAPGTASVRGVINQQSRCPDTCCRSSLARPAESQPGRHQILTGRIPILDVEPVVLRWQPPCEGS